jgi:A/G-specific adenine glycosylase
MDYGSFLKRSGVRVNGKSKHYTKQKTFLGSDREVRGAILRELSKKPAPKARLVGLLGDARVEQSETQLAKLLTEGLIEKRGGVFTLPR